MSALLRRFFAALSAGRSGPQNLVALSAKPMAQPRPPGSRTTCPTTGWRVVALPSDERSGRILKRLQLDHLVLNLLYSLEPLAPLKDMLGTLNGLVRYGKVRQVGVCNMAF